NLLPVTNEGAAQLTRLLKPAPPSDGDDSTNVLSYLADIDGAIRAIRIMAISNGSYETQRGTLESIANVPSELTVWDAGDLATAIFHSAVRQQTIDFSDSPQGGIRVLGPIGENEMSSFLMALPGDLIADLYQAH